MQRDSDFPWGIRGPPKIVFLRPELMWMESSLVHYLKSFSSILSRRTDICKKDGRIVTTHDRIRLHTPGPRSPARATHGDRRTPASVPSERLRVRARRAHRGPAKRNGRFHACEAALRHKGRKGLAVPARQTVRPQKDALQPSWAAGCTRHAAHRAHTAPDQTQGGFAHGQRLRPSFTRQSRFSRLAADHGHARRAWRGACGRKKV